MNIFVNKDFWIYEIFGENSVNYEFNTLFLVYQTVEKLF